MKDGDNELQRFERILSVVASILTILAAIMTIFAVLQGIAPAWRSNIFYLAWSFTPAILLFIAMIAVLTSKPLIAATIYLLGLGAYVAQFNFETLPLTRNSVALFVAGCTSFGILIVLSLGLYFFHRILRLIERQLDLIDLVRQK